MNDFKAYIGKQNGLMRQASARISLARNLLSNHNSLTSFSDNEIRINNSNERSTGVTYLDPVSSDDPVYKKISEVIGQIHDPSYSNSFYDIAPMLDGKVTTLQIEIEGRKMTKSTYEHLLDTPIDVLLKEWSDEIRNRLEHQ